jgi:hypothetical protein
MPWGSNEWAIDIKVAHTLTGLQNPDDATSTIGPASNAKKGQSDGRADYM